MFKPVPVEVINSYDFSIENRPLSIGIPCPEGVIFNQQCLKLIDNRQSIQFNATRLASWPDGSTRWLLLDFQASMEANSQNVVPARG